MSTQTDKHPRHDITICQDNITGIGTHVYLGSTELHGIRGITYEVYADDLPPKVNLEILPSRCNVNVLADLGLSVDIDSLTTAIKCIQFEMQLNSDFKDAVRASVLSALSEIDFTETTLSKAADLLIDRIFFGER